MEENTTQTNPFLKQDSALMKMLEEMNKLPSPPAPPAVYVNQITVNINLPELKIKK